MTKKQQDKEHEYTVDLVVRYDAEEFGTYTVIAETREEAEEAAIDQAQEYRDSQIVGCQGISDGDWSVESIERTDGKDVDGDEHDEDE